MEEIRVKVYHDDQPDNVVDRIAGALRKHGIEINWDGVEEDSVMTYIIKVSPCPNNCCTKINLDV